MEKKVMSDYSLYCTQEQTLKAIELGAPIEGMFIPTAEQMLGCLEEQGILVEFTRFMGKYAFRLLKLHGLAEQNLHIQGQNYTSHKEATLAAIDAALDYLIKSKEEQHGTY